MVGETARPAGERLGFDVRRDDTDVAMGIADHVGCNASDKGPFESVSLVGSITINSFPESFAGFRIARRAIRH